MTYREAIDWLYSTQMFGIKLGLDGPRRLLREFLAFPSHGVKVIQVAGTNGKGSVCAFADSLARSCGWRTGLFTSPHLVDYRERIQVSGAMIPEHVCADYLTQLREISESLPANEHPTFFEITLACAMRYFRESGCEVIILEVGMGGRLDATTAVPSDVSVITPIALDHTKWLGETHAEIALEKAGIMREGVPVFSAKQVPEAGEVIKKEANQTRSPLEFVTEPTLSYGLGLPGPHQRENASLALSALHALNAPLSFDAVKDGLKAARHPGRFEEIRPGLIVDAAHNPHAAESLVATWKQRFGEKKARLVFGAVEDKEVGQVLSLLEEIISEIIFVPVNSQRGLPPESLLPLTTLPSQAFGTLGEAIESLEGEASPVLLTGSLFLVGEAKALLENGLHRTSEQ